MAQAAPFLIIGAVGIIGLWLLQKKPNAPDPVPPFNQALRGTPRPFTFGTNRVSAQVTWTYGFNAQPSGGGKFGGSGGAGGAKAGGGGLGGYNYFWDLVYDFGMVDQPSVITRAWIGADRLASTRQSGGFGGVWSWNQNIDQGTVQALYNLSVQTTGVDTPWAHMNYLDAYAGNGFPTGDARLEPWSYYQSKNGAQPFSFPSTMYVGFEQLGLGQTTSIPQLSVEITPLSAGETGSLIANHGYLSNFLDYESSLTQGMMLLSDGTHLVCGQISADTLTLLCVETGAEYTRTPAQLATDITSYGLAGTWTATIDCCYFVAPGTPYVWFLSDNIAGHIAGIRYKIGPGGTFTIDGGMYSSVVDDSPFISNVSNCFDSQVINGSVVLLSEGGGLSLLTLPLSGDYTGTFDSACTLFGVGTNYRFLFGGNRSRVAGMSLSPSGEVIAYIGQAEYDYAVANLISNANWASFTAPGVYLIGVGAITNINASFGFTDIKCHLDGSPSSSYYDDYCAPTFFQLSGTTYIVFGRGYSLAADNGAIGCVNRVRIYSWSGHVGTFVSDVTASTFDPVANLGVTSGNRDAVYSKSFQIMSDGSALYFNWRPAAGVNVQVFGTYATAVSGTNGLDVTPPYIIKQILTSTTYGFGSSQYGALPIAIDSASYNDAVSFCQQNGIFISATYDRQDDLLKIINDLLALYNGTLTEQAGVIYFNVVRAGDTSFRTIDNDHLLVEKTGSPPVQVTEGAVQDGYNNIAYHFIDRLNEYKKNVVYVEDPVDIDFNGPRDFSMDPKYVMTGSLAQRLAEQALWNNIYGRNTFDFQLGWKDADLRPGIQITLVDSYHPLLAGGVKCIITNWDEKKRGKFTVKASQIFDSYLNAGHGYINNSSAGNGAGGIMQAAAPLLDFRAYELPEQFQPTPVIFFGYNQGSYIKGAQLYLSNEAAGNFVLTQDVQPFEISGVLGNALPSRLNGAIEIDFPLWLFPTSGFNAATPTFVQTYALADASQATRAAGLTTLIVGSEALAMENLVLIGQNQYQVGKLYRGWGGTPITSHNSGDYFHQHGIGTFALPVTQGQIGTALYYKIVGYDFAGNLYDVSSVAVHSYTVKGMYWRPRYAADVQVFVASAVSWPASTAFRGTYLTLNSGGCDLAIQWPPSANVEGFGAGGFGAGGFGHWAQDTTPQYRVNVSSSNGTAVSCYATTSGYFGYTVAQNSADFNGLAKNPIFKVTPYTVKGDGPTAAVLSLSFTW